MLRTLSTVIAAITICSLARAGLVQVRQAHGVPGLHYRQPPDGEFNHGSELIVFDAEDRTTRAPR